MKFISYLCVIICIFLNYNFALAHGWKAPVEAAKRDNPIKFTDRSQQNGKALFLDNCAYCHGEGAIGLSKDKTGLPMDTPNLIHRLKNHTEGDFFWKIQNGRGRMPSFKGDLSDKDIWDSINYIKGLSTR